MKKLFVSLSICSLCLNVLFAVLYSAFGTGVLFSLCVTSGTILYHLVMRLVVGGTVGHSFSHHSWWFAEKSFERKLYKLLRVKRWKRFMPSYDKGGYVINATSLQDVIDTTCRNEVVHEVNMLLSFVPILFGLYAGVYPVFVITSVVACLVDGIFVVMQRYNRPRLVKTLNRRNKK